MSTIAATRQLIGPALYPDDAYDRIWVPANGFIVTENVKGEARSIDTSSAQDNNPPEAVLQNAVETIGTL
ncbi:hypothetical protein ACE6H2_018634 [Prunus campanulata]